MARGLAAGRLAKAAHAGAAAVVPLCLSAYPPSPEGLIATADDAVVRPRITPLLGAATAKQRRGRRPIGPPDGGKAGPRRLVTTAIGQTVAAACMIAVAEPV